jgi:hypothetical protein
MGFSYTKSSQAKLLECDIRLQNIFNKAIELIDVTILEGHRPKHLQDLAFANGNSRVPWPKGKHNKVPSMAVDAAPCPIDWRNRERFVYFAGMILGIGAAQGVKIRWGGSFDRDSDLGNDSFIDLPHFEIDEL